MVQFKVLSGRMAGHETVVRRFPFQIGRSSRAGLQLDDPGVWDQHVCVDLKRSDGFCLTAVGGALVAVNDQPVRETRLRNGDRIAVGSAQLQFWLAETRLRGLRFREGLVWACVGVVTVGQLALLSWLLN